MINAASMRDDTYNAASTDAAGPRWLFDLLAIAWIVLVAGFFRLWRIDQVPPGLGYDEAAYGHLTLHLLQGKLVLAYELGVVHSYLAAPFVALLGRIPLALRLPEALAGIAAAVMLYLYVREAFGSRLAAALAALIYAITFEAVHVSRLAFPSNTLPLVQAATFYFFWRGWRRRDNPGGLWSLAASGLFLGIAVQSYYAGLAIVAGMGLAWIAWLWRERRRALPGAVAFWTAFLLPVLPWLVVVAPQVLGSPHTGGQFVLSSAVHQGAPLQLLARQALEHAGLFGFAGDEIWRHNLPGRPFFDLPLALFFWGGVALALVRVRLAPYAFLLVQLIFGILPGALARTDTGPVILHLTAMFVPACVFPALAVHWLVDKAGARRRWVGAAAVALFCVLLGITARRTYVDYFQTWAQGVAGSMSFDELFVETAQVMNQRTTEEVDAWVLPMSGTAGSEGQARSLDFVYDQATPVLWVAANDNTAGVTLQEHLASGGQRVGLVTWDWDALKWAAPAYTDEKGLLRFLLAQNGRLVERQTHDGFTVDVYQMAADPAFNALRSQMHPSDAAFGDGALTLSSYAFDGMNGSAATAGEPLTLALQWHASQPPGRDLKAAVLLVDRAGHVILQDDRPLRDAAGATSAMWPAGASGLDVRLLDLPAGTPPGEYQLHVAVYDATTLERLSVARGDKAAARVAIAGPVRLGPSLGQQAPAVLATLDVAVGQPPRLRLAGHDPLPQQAQPGDTLTLTSYWQALQDAPSAPSIQVELIDLASGAVAQSQVIALSNDFPTTRWLTGQWITDRNDVKLNRDLPSGKYSVQLAIDGGDGSTQRVELGSVDVAGWARQFDPPDVGQQTDVRFGDEMKLVGYTVGPAMIGQPLAVTLCWQALTKMDTSYVTFVHLLDANDALQSQNDAVPGQGAYPTTGWLPGEYVCSNYELLLASDHLQGEYSLQMGAYDPSSEARLIARDSSDNVLNNNTSSVKLEIGAD